MSTMGYIISALWFVLFVVVAIIGGSRGDRLMELHHVLGHSSSDKHEDVMKTAMAAREALEEKP